ncbi:MAG: hypothetical protein KDC79_14110 [Cyclobacteriaceae bacterium]|nr:hypothetical protein [Cyclobacteriaceae bacterium]
MKRVDTIKWHLMLAIVFMASFLGSCKKKAPEPDARTLQMQKLSASWKVNSVENDDLDVTSQYSGFTLTVNDLKYTTTNGGNPWPSSGTYDFKDADLTILVRSDGTEIQIEELTSSTLVLSFNYNSLTGGRTNGVTGNFIFSLKK